MPRSRYHAWRRVAVVCAVSTIARPVRARCPANSRPQRSPTSRTWCSGSRVPAHAPAHLEGFTPSASAGSSQPTSTQRRLHSRAWLAPPSLAGPPCQAHRRCSRGSPERDLAHRRLGPQVARRHQGLYPRGSSTTSRAVILAWTIGARLDPTATCGVLVEAGQQLDGTRARPTIGVMTDSGVENVNAAVDRHPSGRTPPPSPRSGRGHRVEPDDRGVVALPQASVALPQLPRHHRACARVGRVLRRRAQLQEAPHAAFRGHTPDEVFLGTAPHLSAELEVARAKARETRRAANRRASCGRCAPATESAIPP